MCENFIKPTQSRIPVPNNKTIPRLLEENNLLLTAITEDFNKGRILADSMDIHKKLHRNLVYLTCLAYPNKTQSEIYHLIPVRTIYNRVFTTFVSLFNLVL